MKCLKPPLKKEPEGICVLNNIYEKMCRIIL